MNSTLTILQCLPGPAHTLSCVRCHKKEIECPGLTEARRRAPATPPTEGVVIDSAVDPTQLSHAGWGPFGPLEADKGLAPDAALLKQLMHQACVVCRTLRQNARHFSVLRVQASPNYLLICRNLVRDGRSWKCLPSVHPRASRHPPHRPPLHATSSPVPSQHLSMAYVLAPLYVAVVAKAYYGQR